jgi:repressor LexA
MTGTQSVGDNQRDHALTERRKAIVDFHGEYMERLAYPPTHREIGDAVGLKTISAVAYQLKILEEMGHLTRTARRSRTAVAGPSSGRDILQRSGKPGSALASTSSPDMASVPLFERIAAGIPVMANREPEDVMQLPRKKVGFGDLFAVRVVGDSNDQREYFRR